MKLNWGSGIAIFYSLFVVVMIMMVVKSTQNKAHMVQDNYYKKDLNYEEFRQKRQNGMAYKNLLNINYDQSDRLILISFPKQMAEAKGELKLFRPSNQYLDKNYPIRLDSNGKMFIQIEDNMVRGKWRVMLDWHFAGTNYYNEETIVI
ncbi:MAG: FixH family protein [Saprospiraceae bacterium]|jgi:hypothetical protein